ncbi:adenylosuccinate synthetase [uncultured Dokdonia sp.]|nr:adenylosuccinate synthetase [uncultured Dokdonia sp.]
MQLPKSQNNAPIDPSSPVELIVFIALPILLIVVYFIARRRQRKNKDV